MQGNNAIFTWASGKEFLELPEFKVFRESFNQNCFADLWIFSHDLPEEVENSFHADGYWVFRTPKVLFLLRDRWYFYLQRLRECNYNYVLICDSKDVLFQSDPFEIVKELDVKTEFLLFVEEGGLHYQSEWNVRDQYKLQLGIDPQWKQDFARHPIINGGFIMGTPKKLCDFSLLLWSNMLHGSLTFTDQAMINFLHYWLEEDPEVYVYNPNHVNTPPYCLIGEGIKRGWLTNPPSLKDAIIVDYMNEPYFAIHQWERTEWRNELMETYNG